MTSQKNDTQKKDDAINLAIKEIAEKHNISTGKVFEIYINQLDDSATIADLQKAIANRLEDVKAEALSRYIQEGKKMASALGIDPQAIVEGLTSTRTKNQQIEPKYRSKTNPLDTWSGRGKKPRWLTAEIEKGAALEDFLI